MRRAAVSAVLTLALLPAFGSAQQGGDVSARYVRREVMIPMRDGVRLHTIIYSPPSPGPHPFILERTPYGIARSARALDNSLRPMAEDSGGYIFVFQDIRGRYGSEGRFVMQRPPRDPADSTAIDEGTDTYDTIDWLLENVPHNNGKVGMLGVSYPGWLTVMAMLDPHPALKAVSPQASPADMFIGDDFHHNGAFRLSYGFEYAAMMETSKVNANFSFDRYDTYQWYLALGPLSNVNARYLHGKIPTWNDYVAHPNYDAFWQRRAVTPYLTRVTVPTLNVAGWWDQEDFYGPITIYRELEKHDSQNRNFLVVGPWNHGGWSRGPGRRLGRIDFGSATGQYFRTRIEAPFFAHYLKGRDLPREPEAVTFEAGDNQWHTWSAWPPKTDVRDADLYLHGDGNLSFDAPSDAGVVSYLSDPAHPVPYRHRPIEPTYFPGGSGWYTWLLEDQRFVDNRPDVATWVSAPLDHDVTITGDITARLFAATTGSAADWVVKLIDVYPEKYEPNPKLGGWELMVANDVFRGRFRNGYTHPEPITPGKVTAYTIDLHTQDYRFLKGHRIMVQVQSTWFPIIDRNPQTYVPNIFKARASDYRKATQSIYASPRYPSRISVHVVTDAQGASGSRSH
ncbi:MAG: CocE/NonD family hydrolase [Gemmatimonadota bacterium]|jgi:putative CocE/NonD family hydrolase